MISLQKLFGKDDRFFDLLERSADLVKRSIDELNGVLKAPAGHLDMATFHARKEADKVLTREINEALVQTFVTQLEKEDIEALSNALYKIPKTIEKIAERFLILRAHVAAHDFTPYVALLDTAGSRLAEMVKQLRHMGSGRLEQTKRLNSEISQAESAADDLMLAQLKTLYASESDPVRILALKDVFELLEKTVDRCRDAGNTVAFIVLKNT
jgi:uncharacterized protein